MPQGDEIVTGRGDGDGWHLYAASTGTPGGWQPLATLDPAEVNPNGEQWIGRQCLTGDGRYVVAVVAPWSANNSSQGADRGGIAYVVDAHTGAVRPLVAGVSLHYFTPSCGSGDTVALTRYAGADEQTTQVVLADAASARVVGVQRVAGELTGAVPAPDGGVFAAEGKTIVHLVRGRKSTRARVDGQPFDLVANAAGGVDFLLGKNKSATVWTLDGRRARQVGTGAFDRLALHPGRSGHTIATGTSRLDAASGIRALPSTTPAIEAVSLGGALIAPVPTAAALPTGQAERQPLLLAATGGTTRRWLPDAAAPPSKKLPEVLTDSGALAAPVSPSPRTLAQPGTGHPAAATGRAGNSARSSTASYVSTCAVGRNDVYLQAMQPSPEDVQWAANLAGRGDLSGQYARPADYANLNLPTGYSPSLDFPLPAPFGPSGKSVPREVLEGIIAQESNFNQATWHSVQGVAGNPLIADYYGAGGGYVAGVQDPDCGYGLGQVTTGMHIGDMAYDLQRKVAVDYAENVAAAAQILAQKWNELSAAGITANNADPGTLENWYLAIWDYNSGLHPNTGSGPWGLGWRNNPANPIYPYNRHPFLHEDNPGGLPPTVTYEDASTPADWPYQEKVFGWMEVPLKNASSGHASYQGLIQSYDSVTGSDQVNVAWQVLARPDRGTFCDVNQNSCDPHAPQGTGPCTLASLECWWHAPVAWCNILINPCTTGSWEYNPGDAEPSAADGNLDPVPVCSVLDSDVPHGSVIVDSQASDVNLQGCNSSNTNWKSSGSFSFTFGDPAHPGSQATDMDVHQLGAGLGGHIWFTHTNEPADSNGVSLWGATGTWTPSLSKGRYLVKVFVPNAGATATEANYTVNNGLGISHTVTINQNASTGWVPLGTFWLGPGASVSLTNLGVTSGGDLAFSGVAFVPQAAGRYVMLGDSYSSGEGAGTYDPQTNNYSTPQGTNNAHRSTKSYNRLFAARTTTFGAVTDPSSTSPAKNWDHVACSGAVVADFYASSGAPPQTGKLTGTCPNEPGQHIYLNAQTSLVTLTFGGNDLDFSPVVQDCVYAGLQNAIGSPILKYPYATCQEKWDAKLQQKIADLSSPSSSTGLVQLYRDIKREAPNAEIVVLGYPHLVRPSTEPNGRCLANGAIVDSDREWLNTMAGRLDTAIQNAAQTAGVDYISVDSQFTGHELCTPDPYLTGIGDPTINDTYPGEASFLQQVGLDKQQFFHPNLNGYAAEADLLARYLPVP